MSDQLDSPPGSIAASTTTRIRLGLRTPRFWVLAGLLAVVAAFAELIGPAVIPLGFASVTLLPMVWGLIGGVAVSAQRYRPLGLDLQVTATVVMGVAVLLLCARLAFTIGPNIPLLVQAGPALLLQEVGHLFGTILLALPLAVLLRMGPATVGATFSVDREASFAMVTERYGADSPQYRGVLSMYVFGSIFGAALVSVIASMATSLRIFDPLALAMGAGIGSGSMMAAAAASVVAEHPEMKDQVLAVAATSNLLTTVMGLYVGMYVALPLAERVYRFLTRRATTGAPATKARTAPAAVALPQVTVPLYVTLPLVVVVGVIVSTISGGFSLAMVGGYLILAALVGLGLGITRLSRGRIGALVVVVTVGALVSSPISPIAKPLGAVVGTVDFLAICTVVLTVAGLSLGKDLPMLRSIGWRIIPVGIVAIGASYLLSTVVAEFALGLWH